MLPVPVQVFQEPPPQERSPFNFGIMHHQGLSSVAVNEYGHYVEVRRGHKRLEKIEKQCIWSNFQHWSDFVASMNRDWFLDRPVRTEWNADQQLVADFTEGSNLRIRPVSPERFDQVQFALNRAQIEYNQYPSVENYHRNWFWNIKHQELDRDIRLGGEYVPSGRARILILDQHGTLKPVYIHLDTGILVTSNNIVGRSFQELGIVPQIIYANAFGEYFRIR